MKTIIVFLLLAMTAISGASSVPSQACPNFTGNYYCRGPGYTGDYSISQRVDPEDNATVYDFKYIRGNKVTSYKADRKAYATAYPKSPTHPDIKGSTAIRTYSCKNNSVFGIIAWSVKYEDGTDYAIVQEERKLLPNGDFVLYSESSDDPGFVNETICSKK